MNDEVKEESTVLEGVVSLAVLVGVLIFLYSNFNVVRDYLPSFITQYSGGVVYDAFTPGISTRGDYERFIDAGGIENIRNNDWFQFEINSVSGLVYDENDLLRQAVLGFSGFSDPVPADIKSHIADICGVSEMKRIKSSKDRVVYGAESDDYICSYLYLINGSVNEVVMEYKNRGE